MVNVTALEDVAPAMVPFRSETPRGVDFAAVSSALGSDLPTDFKELARHYPTLEFDGFLRVPLPRPGAETAFADGIRRELEILRDLQDDDMAEGYEAHPAPNGLIPWSESLSGDVFYWRVAGSDPDSWPVVVSGRNDDWWEFPGGAVAFLVGLIDGSAERRGLPGDVPSRHPAVRAFPG
ncbi:MULTISPECIES: SMI1/KNR4 family protein [unclassified Streptomyces]|uniref:SMI1/KNR4 family protein n=1 Tax=unclassified Streptomyces TaxID=2593676 RepID=UPI002E2B20C0|nr:SMI1/KNR4 family protein [Streptomyces sp. NBC_01423]WSX92720.1 SMI1/KNR4 family protein [Streptomyces sp. NBC_00891]WSY07197.1 SMI1/KNR4 family protein [Streptomyces sp. NBC_00890]WSZ08824.1 SMI1/KNR4 family protein [Streptomyces sp. NBC_00869]WSZ23678.1 SMI1/KNR4 family protein [Streptomyces sp. NBC_00870]